MVIYSVNPHITPEQGEEINKYGIATAGKKSDMSFFFHKDMHHIDWSEDKGRVETLLIRTDPTVSKEEFKKYLSKFKNLTRILHIGHLYHVDDYLDFKYEESRFKNKFLEALPYKFYMVHPNPLQKEIGIYFDYSLSLLKYTFQSEHEEIKENKYAHLFNNDSRMYDITNSFQLDSNENTHRIFLAPNNAYPGNPHPRMTARLAVTKALEPLSVYQPDSLKNIHLESQIANSFQVEETLKGHRGFWFPIHNWYYRNTMITAVVESIVKKGPSMSATEKIWVPLIKGHFILPFGPPRFVEFLQKEYGIIFPNWIKYGYDHIDDNMDRLGAYIAEINRLGRLPIEEVRILYNNSLEILKANRENVLGGFAPSGLQLIQSYDASRS